MDVNDLEFYLQNHIQEKGPIPLADYMDFCLFHPKFGYYMKQNPFGRSGDFITSPEISQMFGELLGVWAISQWQLLGKPRKFNLVELGPGQGTLMSDLLRVAERHPEFFKALRLQLIETSPMLIAQQKMILSNYKPTWHSSITDISAVSYTHLTLPTKRIV